MELKKDVLSQAATEARGLAIDGVVAAGKVGHLGLPLGAAEIGAVLYGQALRINPANPRWLNRDRFVLSAGHGSMFQYGWMHLAGFDLSKEDLAAFRSLHSKTPGHPEYGETEGVECTTGPLGQGVGNAVGMAVAGKLSEAHFNTDAQKIFDYKVICLAGDGCAQEGVALEAVAFAGHQKLDNLILIYDYNEVTLDAQAEDTQSGDVVARYESFGWEVQSVDGHDLEALAAAVERARNTTSGKPQFIIARTEIGRGIPEVAGTWKAHGEGGAAFADAAREGLGLPKEPFYVSEQTREYFAELKKTRAAANQAWDETFAAWKQANPEKAKLLEEGYAKKVPSTAELFQMVAAFPSDKAVATRATAGKALTAIAKRLPLVVSGSADLHGSTKNYLDDCGGDFKPGNRTGRNFRFGIREHAMGAIVNGLCYDGLWIASGATFFTFSDYMRASVRLSALSKIPSLWYWTHDSIGVGVDGPTHQPVEQIASLRAMPGLDMIKPADAEESVGAIVASLERRDGPTGLSLSRQNLPLLDSIPVQTRREGVLKGGYIARKETGDLCCILMSCGSELSLALEAAEALGEGCRVVSMPCMERFERQSAAYREEVLPASCRKRIAVEAVAGQHWWKYLGFEGKLISVERFGASAPGDQVMQECGITKEAVIDAAKGSCGC
ncbi:MAG: transketolase [Verrucomicrobiota bacterium]